jgi:Ca2+-binding RTX toxin-like protein
MRCGASPFVAVLAFLAFAAPAHAAFTAGPGLEPIPFAPGPVVQFHGDGASDTLVFRVLADHVEHNRFGVDPGFESASDFDSAAPGVQAYGGTFSPRLDVVDDGGTDTVSVIDARGAAATFLHRFDGDEGCLLEQTGPTSSRTDICYLQGVVERFEFHGGPGKDDISSLDSMRGTALVLDGGGGDDRISQDGRDANHDIRSPVSLVGGDGEDFAALTEDQRLKGTYTVGGGQIASTLYPPVSYDATVETISVRGPVGAANIKVTEQRKMTVSAELQVAGTIDATGAGAQTSVDGLGSTGNDVIKGGAGRDTLFGREGGDTMEGGPGDDQLSGESGGNRAVTGEGGDTIDGGPGRDLMQGEGGADLLASRDGRAEPLDCGAGNDRAETDLTESDATGCERVGASRNGARLTDALLTLGSLRQASVLSKGLTVKVKAAAAARPSAKLTQFPGGSALASAAAPRSTRSTTLTLKPSASAARTIRALRDPTLYLVVKLGGPGGAATITQRVKLTR